MPYDLPLPKKLKARGWKVKIREKERLEPPHITILCGEDEWRIGLRDGEFLVPPGGSWKDVDVDVRKAINESWEELRRQWNMKYPTNPA